MAMTPEAKVKAQIKQYLTSLGAFFFSPIGGPYTEAGIPDLVGCLWGYFFGIEVKALGKKRTVTPLQKIKLEAISKAGGVAVLADCVEDVAQAFHPILIAASMRAASHANNSVRNTP